MKHKMSGHELGTVGARDAPLIWELYRLPAFPGVWWGESVRGWERATEGRDWRPNGWWAWWDKRTNASRKANPTILVVVLMMFARCHTYRFAIAINTIHISVLKENQLFRGSSDIDLLHSIK